MYYCKSNVTSINSRYTFYDFFYWQCQYSSEHTLTTNFVNRMKLFIAPIPHKNVHQFVVRRMKSRISRWDQNHLYFMAYTFFVASVALVRWSHPQQNIVYLLNEEYLGWAGHKETGFYSSDCECFAPSIFSAIFLCLHTLRLIQIQLFLYELHLVGW